MYLGHQAQTVNNKYTPLSHVLLILLILFYEIYLVFDRNKKTDMGERNNSMHWKKIILHVAKLCIQQVLKFSWFLTSLLANLFNRVQGACKAGVCKCLGCEREQ